MREYRANLVVTLTCDRCRKQWASEDTFARTGAPFGDLTTWQSTLRQATEYDSGVRQVQVAGKTVDLCPECKALVLQVVAPLEVSS